MLILRRLCVGQGGMVAAGLHMYKKQEAKGNKPAGMSFGYIGEQKKEEAPPKDQGGKDKGKGGAGPSPEKKKGGKKKRRDLAGILRTAIYRRGLGRPVRRWARVESDIADFGF